MLATMNFRRKRRTIPLGGLVAALTASIFSTPATAADGPTPFDAELAAGGTTLIASQLSPTDAHLPRSSQFMHYRLQLPTDYHQNGQRKYPVMFIASPIGNAEMGEMTDVLVRDRWIVAMLIESRNGSPDWIPNFMAAYDDLHRRVRVQEKMIFCTGMSGGAKVCSAYPDMRPGFRGMILQAAGPWGRKVFSDPDNHDLLVYGTFGTFDPNFHHAKRIRLSLPPDVRRLVTVWEGGHDWAPRAIIEPALAWTVSAALLDSPFDPVLNDAYQWYAENRLADFDRAATDIARYAALQSVDGLPSEWRSTADPALVERVDAALAAHSSPPEAEVAAYSAFTDALRDDEDDHGRNSGTVAAAYQAIADRFSETVYGALAAERARAVTWETGRYP